MRLSELALGVNIFQLNGSALTNGDRGEMVTYVGFGVTNGLTGAGVAALSVNDDFEQISHLSLF